MNTAAKPGAALFLAMIAASATLADAHRMRLDYGSVALEVVLEPAPVRSEGFAVYLQGEGGALTRIGAPEPRTVSGRIEGFPGSAVSGSFDGEAYDLRLSVPGFGTLVADSSSGVRHLADDAPRAIECGWDETGSGASATAGPGPLCTGTCVVDIAVDIDSAALAMYGSEADAIASLETDLAMINELFGIGAGIRFELGTLVIRDDPASDPYANLPVIDRLVMAHVIGKEWRDALGDTERDTVMVVTGLDFPFIAGVNIGNACGPADEDGFRPRGFVELENPDFTTLLAHELGHAVGSNHCQSRGAFGTRGFLCPSFLMNAGGASGRRFVTDAPGLVGEAFEAETVDFIEAYARNGAADCLDTLPGTTRFIRVPDVSNDPPGQINPRAWLESASVTPVEDGADGPDVVFDRPSTHTLRLRGDALLATGTLDARMRDRFDIELIVARGFPGDPPDDGDALLFEYLDDAGVWRTAHEFEGDGASGEVAAAFAIDDPSSRYDAVRFRVRTTGAHGVGDTDDWYLVSALIRDRYAEIDPPAPLLPEDGATGLGFVPSPGLFAVSFEWAGDPDTFRSVLQVVEPTVLVEDDPGTPEDETVLDVTFFTNDKMEFDTTSTAHTLLTLERGTRYAWRAVAFSADGVARVSDTRLFETIDAFPPGPPTVASPPDGAVLATLSPTLIFIVPSSGDEVESYTLLLDDDPTFASPIEITGDDLVFDPTMSFATYTPPEGTLADNTTYAWRVDATNAGGTGSSSVRTFTVRTCPADCDEDGDIDFNDLVCALFLFGETSDGRADCDGSGTVEFADLVCSVTSFGACE
ncbi:MAG: hypothetical protein RLN60_00855 [Phycisphaerales bacterium]